jgi:predicted site-specific integrase-resolvase
MATLPILLPLSEAARKYGLDEARLRALIAKGTIRAAMMNNQVVISEDDAQAQAKPLRKEDLPEWKKHAHLKGTPIWILKAAEKYRVPFSTLRGWVTKGYIKVVGSEGKKVLLNEQDIAYCTEIYHRRKGQGKWLFDSNGLPYKPKTGPLAL